MLRKRYNTGNGWCSMGRGGLGHRELRKDPDWAVHAVGPQEPAGRGLSDPILRDDV
jgi:hypothetical protein